LPVDYALFPGIDGIHQLFPVQQPVVDLELKIAGEDAVEKLDYPQGDIKGACALGRTGYDAQAPGRALRIVEGDKILYYCLAAPSFQRGQQLSGLLGAELSVPNHLQYFQALFHGLTPPSRFQRGCRLRYLSP